jgi:hypothetical protein
MKTEKIHCVTRIRHGRQQSQEIQCEIIKIYSDVEKKSEQKMTRVHRTRQAVTVPVVQVVGLTRSEFSHVL